MVPLPFALQRYVNVGGRVNPQIWKLIFKGEKKEALEKALTRRLVAWPRFRGRGYISSGRIGCSRCLRVSGEFFDRSGFGADRAAEQQSSGAERLNEERMNEASKEERKVKSKLEFIEGLEEKERHRQTHFDLVHRCARFRANIVPVR